MPLIPPTSSGAYAQLASVVLSGTSTTIDTGAAGFATTYTHLSAILYARTDEAAVIFSQAAFRVNGDSATNYDYTDVNGLAAATPAVVSSQFSQSALQILVPGNSVNAGIFGSVTIDIPFYAGAASNRTIIAYGGWADSSTGNDCVATYAARYRLGTAISRLSVTASGGANFIAGSRLDVYALA